MQYLILSSYDADSLAKEVNTYLNRGFEPLGGVAIAACSHATYLTYAQAMIMKNIANETNI
jgi:hypothetical protein